MGKISPVSIKYIIHAKFIATGTVEKPDVVGAVFGQTEGLLGDELELRELQKEGKIGRIDVETESEGGKTTGRIEIPTALDKTETTLIAAALETIERVGPSDAKIQIDEIEDVRGSKRDYIMERAKALLETVKGSQTETKELTESVKESSRISRLQEYGTERLPAGDLSSDEIIVVEGRADVVNMLRHGIDNVIGMNGTVMPSAIKILGKEKSITLFVDGDRGGLLIARNLIGNAKIDFVVAAPEGKEVEELAGKEILAALRKKISVEEFMQQVESHERDSKGRGRKPLRRASRGINMEESDSPKEKPEIKNAAPSNAEKETFKERLEDLIGTRGAYILDSKLAILRKIPVGELGYSLGILADKAYAIVLDGTATPDIVKAAERTACRHIIAKNFTSFATRLNLISL
ncbi:MAG: DNA primase DnaG [archaeon]